MTCSQIPPLGLNDGERNMQSLKEKLRLLYRVHFKGAITQHDPKQGLVAGSLCNGDHAETVENSVSPPTSALENSKKPTRQEVESYMNEELVHSRLIWTTMSLTTALHWANKASQFPLLRKNIRIIVIDAEKVADHAYTALEILEERTKNWNFANSLQVVFVANKISHEAIVSVKSWESLTKHLPSWLQEPGYEPPTFVQLGKDVESSKMKNLFNKIRRNYGTCCKGPLVEQMQLKALDFALFLLDPGDDSPDEKKRKYSTDKHAVDLLCDLAWYILTFPITDWSGVESAAAYPYPTDEQRYRFDELVERDVGCKGGDHETSELNKLIGKLNVNDS
jgi:hypothetical protein